jgi:hypothetical protein
MAKTFIPNTAASGNQTPFDNIVGLQTVDGGGLTQGNFTFTTTVQEKVNRQFNIGTFSNPINLDSMNVNNMIESRKAAAKDYRVYPNFDLSQVTTFSLYGSLSKRLEVSVTKILNFFPASLDVDFIYYDLTTGNTAYNISYNQIANETTFFVSVPRIKNPFNIDFSSAATINLQSREYDYSPLRNLTTEYLKYSLYLLGIEYPIQDFNSSSSLFGGVCEFVVTGNPFSGESTSVLPLVIRPNTFYTEQTFSDAFDEVEKFLLDRLVEPAYTATFTVPVQTENGTLVDQSRAVTWPLDGQWNLDIRTPSFDDYLAQLSEIGIQFDESKTNLVLRFFTTEAFKEFDTPDQKIAKVLQIYGRSFDEVKKFIDGMAFMTSVNYNVGNDIPSALLKNLALTLGWEPNMSPITDTNFLDSVYGTGGTRNYLGYSRPQTPAEVNFQFYRNLILNSGYLFRSKGTRRSIEFTLRLIGAPDFLVDFNEYVYLADARINMKYFNEQYAQISAGTLTTQNVVFDPTVTENILGTIYTGFTINLETQTVDLTREEYPVDEEGWPRAPIPTNNYFFQQGAGWYQPQPDHISPSEVNQSLSVYTGNSPNVQTELQPFTYGQKYYERFRNFPYMREGFKLRATIDNKKSWQPPKIRKSVDAGYNAYYVVQDDRLVLNAKNIDLFLNSSFGYSYDVWKMSRNYNYPIPSTGLTVPYPQPGGIDWTVINPEPDKISFFEFAQTFWRTMINVRNRQTLFDGKTSGYPTLSALFWRYLESEQVAGVPNDKFTYQKISNYLEGIGSYWIQLVKQMIPATTIWNTGLRYENSIFHRQKFVYRIQRGCEIITQTYEPCGCQGDLLPYDCTDEFVTFGVYPWAVGESNASSLSDVLFDALNEYLDTNGYVLANCQTNSLSANWYVDIEINGTTVTTYLFYNQYGISDIPTPNDWYNGLINALNSLIDQNYYYQINDGVVRLYSLTCDLPSESNVVLNIGLELNIDCQ